MNIYNKTLCFLEKSMGYLNKGVWGDSYEIKVEILWGEMGFRVALVVKNSPANAGDVTSMGSILGQEDPLEEGMATHSNILAWRIPWTVEPGRLQSIASQRIGCNLAQHSPS